MEIRSKNTALKKQLKREKVQIQTRESAQQKWLKNEELLREEIVKQKG